MYNPWPTILLKLRELRGLSREAAAWRAGVTAVTWYRWERGDAFPKLSNFAGIAESLGCSPAELGFVFSTALFDHYQREVSAADAMDASQTLAHRTLGRVLSPSAPLENEGRRGRISAIRDQMEVLFMELMTVSQGPEEDGE